MIIKGLMKKSKHLVNLKNLLLFSLKFQEKQLEFPLISGVLTYVV